MAGIMKFFKPTDGGGKKTDQGVVGTTAREVFSPVGNTKAVHRAASRSALDTDSDVEILDGDVPTGVKRKRKDIGHTACGLHAAQAHCTGTAKTPQRACQPHASLGCKDDPVAAKPVATFITDVEMAGPDRAPEANIPQEETAELLVEAVPAASTASEAMFSPDPEFRQPTAKRQRVPDAAPELSCSISHMTPQQEQKEQQQLTTNDPDASCNQHQTHMSVAAAVTNARLVVGTVANGLPVPVATPLRPSQRQKPASGVDQQPTSAMEHSPLEELKDQILSQQQQPAQQHNEHQDDTANAFQSPDAQESAADPDAAAAMDADASASAAGGAGAVASTEGGAAAATAAAQATGGGDGAVTGGTAGKSGGPGPCTLPPNMDLGATLESLQQELADLEDALEVEMLLPELDSGLTVVAAASDGGRLTSMPTPVQLCVWLEGRTSPLSALVALLEPLLPLGADPTALRTSLVDLAQRKCYSASAREAPLDGAAASEDATPGRLWVWEVREPRKHLQGDSKDASVRKLAEAMRKRRKELRERLVAVSAAVEALSAYQTLVQPPATPPPAGGGAPAAKAPTAAARRASESRAAKAHNRLSRLADLEAVEAAFRTASEGFEAAAVARAGITSARKERARKEKEMEREKAREEKVRQREEEARAKEAKRAQEDEAKRKAREAAAVNKVGYHSKKELQKSRNIMQSFFKRPVLQSNNKPHRPAGDFGADMAAAGDTAAAAAGQDGASAGVSTGGTAASGSAAPVSTSSQPALRDQLQPAVPSGGGSGGRGSSQPAGATPARERAAPATSTMFNFSKLACRLPDKMVVEALDAAARRLPFPAEQLAEELIVTQKRWRQQRAARKRMIGVPPTWARRPTAPTDLRTLAAQYYGDVAALGLVPEGLRTWRRKLIAFPRKETVRPPYYGSFSRSSTAVTCRRPFGRDSSLDYEVASDEEWEEEPEGESLSDSGDEADSQAGGAAGDGCDDEDDGFIVGDDHLSDDEGAQLSGDPDDPVPVECAATVKGGARGGTTAAASGAVPVPVTARFMDPRLQQLEAAIDRVRTNNRPILLVRPAAVLAAATGTAEAPPGVDVDMDAAGAGAELHCRLRAEPRPGLNTGLDPGLLGALRPVVHYRGGDLAAGVPVAALAPPLELDVYSAYAAAAGPVMVQGLAAGKDAMLMAGATPGGCEGLHGGAAGSAHLGLIAPGVGVGVGTAAAPGSVRGLASGSRGAGRSAGAGLSMTILTALAEVMSRCGDQKMDKIVEGYLATLPPDVKPPPKTKLRDAIKRLGAWSHSSKRWQLHGGSVAAAVEHALAVAAAATAAALTPGAAATPSTATAAAAATAVVPTSAVRALMVDCEPTLTPTPGPHALPPSGLPAPTPTPLLGPLLTPLPTPYSAQGGRPLLYAPTSTPLEGAWTGPVAAHRPMDPQMVMPQTLMLALARLVPEDTAAATTTTTPKPTTATVGTAMLYGGALTPAQTAAAAAGPLGHHAQLPAPGITPGPVPTLLPLQQEPENQQLVIAAVGVPWAEAMDYNDPPRPPPLQQQQQLVAAAASGSVPQPLSATLPGHGTTTMMTTTEAFSALSTSSGLGAVNVPSVITTAIGFCVGPLAVKDEAPAAAPAAAPVGTSSGRHVAAPTPGYGHGMVLPGSPIGKRAGDLHQGLQASDEGSGSQGPGQSTGAAEAGTVDAMIVYRQQGGSGKEEGTSERQEQVAPAAPGGITEMDLEVEAEVEAEAEAAPEVEVEAEAVQMDVVVQCCQTLHRPM